MSEYPSAEILRRIAAWPSDDVPALMEFVREHWRWADFVTEERGFWRLATGGWSGNEEIVDALRDNVMVWVLCWQSSHRGGLHCFKDWKRRGDELPLHGGRLPTPDRDRRA